MRSVRRSLVLVLGASAFAGALALTGCSGADDPPPVTVPYTAGTATIGVGETLVVDFGEINPSIGDAWDLTQAPDEAVLSQGDVETTELNPGADGSGIELAYTFVGESAGTTTIGFTYSYRGDVGDENGRTDDPSPTIEVTVVGD